MEELNDKALTLNKPRELTAKNRLFLQLLTQGNSTLTAYREAGYKGSDHSAYQLRSDLKEELIKVLEGQGIDRAGLMLTLKNLIDRPTIEEVNGTILLKHKLTALNLLAKMVEAQTPVNSPRPQITAFIVNNRPSSAQPSEVIDVTAPYQEDAQ